MKGSARKKWLGDAGRRKKWVGSLGNLRLFTHLGIMMSVPIVFCVWLGNLIDKKLGTAPWFLFIFILIGIAASFLNLYKIVLQEKKRNEDMKR